MRFGLTLLRTVVGVLFLGHGLQKLKGWFGGHGIEGTAKGFEAMGLEPAKPQAVAAGAAETAAGALLVLGLATPLAASMVSGVMTVAIRTVHAKNGVWNMDGGYEYNAVLMASAFALAAEGPGALSLDEALGWSKRGPLVGIAELGAGVAGALAVDRIARRSSSQEQVTVDLRDDIAPAEAGPVLTTEQVVEHAPARG
jgi:putative oxidoreductase